MRDVLGEKKGWEAGKRYWVRNAWGYVRDVVSSKGSYSITSGHLQAGASDVGAFGPQHSHTSDDRAMFQGYYAAPPVCRLVAQDDGRQEASDGGAGCSTTVCRTAFHLSFWFSSFSFRADAGSGSVGSAGWND